MLTSKEKKKGPIFYNYWTHVFVHVMIKSMKILQQIKYTPPRQREVEELTYMHREAIMEECPSVEDRNLRTASNSVFGCLN